MLRGGGGVRTAISTWDGRQITLNCALGDPDQGLNKGHPCSHPVLGCCLRACGKEAKQLLSGQHLGMYLYHYIQK